MKTTISLALFLLVLRPDGFAQTPSVKSDDFPSTLVLSNRVAHFELTDSTLIEGLSKLSFEAIAGLHMGIEEIVRDKSSEPTDRSVRFSLSLHNVTVRDIIDTLCKSDRRYTWSRDGSSINIYPRETVGNSSYLLNRELDSIVLKDINGPTDALTPLMKLLPGEQIGYAGIGVNNDYPKPWNVVFNHLTVRQLMNRLSEHNGPRGGWIWNGSRGQRFFAYFVRDFKEW
jgi:hypothetical protein